MTSAIFRVRLPERSHRLAWGSPAGGPRSLLEPSVSLDRTLGEGVSLGSLAPTTDEPIPDGTRVVAPVESQEVWAAGVTYLRSRDARREEATNPTSYDAVYDADRPEIFFKAAGWRCVGTGDKTGIRADSTWDVPKPEVALVLDARLRIAGYTIGQRRFVEEHRGREHAVPAAGEDTSGPARSSPASCRPRKSTPI